MNSLKQLGVVFVALAVLLTAGTAGALTPTTTGVDRTTTAPDARTDAIAQPLIEQNSLQQQSADRSAEDILRAAQQSYRQIESINATLVATTEISNDSASSTNTAKAKLSFERPAKFRVELLESEQLAGTVIVSNGTTITFYNARTDTARTVNASAFGGMGAMGAGSMGSGSMGTGMMGQAATNPLAQVGTLNQSNVTFEGTATVNGHETYVLSVTPENTTEGLSTEQTLYLDKESYIPVKIVSETTATVRGETTTITSTILLRNLQVNEDIPDSVFEFDAPSDADDGEPTEDGEGDDGADDGEDEQPGAPVDTELGENDEDDDGDGAIDEDDEDASDAPSNDDDDGDGAIDEDDEPDDGDDGSDDFNGEAEDDDDGDGHFDEDDEADGGNSDDEDNDGDGHIDEDDEPDNDD